MCHPWTGAGGCKPPTEVDRLYPYRQSYAARQLLTLLSRGNSARAFALIDSYVHERLALFASRKRKQAGWGWQKRYPLSWLRELGVFRLGGISLRRALHAT